MENFTNWFIIVLLIIAILYALILNFRLPVKFFTDNFANLDVFESIKSATASA